MLLVGCSCESSKEERALNLRQTLTGDLELFYLLSYLPVQEAEQAIQCLNGKLALSKKLVVRWAHAQVKVNF